MHSYKCNTVRSAPTYLSLNKNLKTYFLMKYFPHRLSYLY